MLEYLVQIDTPWIVKGRHIVSLTLHEPVVTEQYAGHGTHEHSIRREEAKQSCGGLDDDPWTPVFGQLIDTIYSSGS